MQKNRKNIFCLALVVMCVFTVSVPLLAQADVVRVQAPAGCSGVGSASCIIVMQPTISGNSIFVMVYSGNGMGITVSDNKSNIYHLDASQVSTEGVFIYSAINAIAGVTSITVSHTGSYGFIGFAAEYSGIDTTSPVDKTSGNTNSSSPYTSGSTAATAQANELLIGMVGTGFSSSANFIVGSGWSYPVSHVSISADGDDAVWQEQIVFSVGTYAATGSSNALTRIQAVLAGYKAATATPPAPMVPVISSFTANPSYITNGQSSTLSWSVSGNPTPTLSIDNGVGTVIGNSVSVSPSQTTTYTLTALNPQGTVTVQNTVTVTALPPPVFGNIYISQNQTGNGSGSDCNNAHPASWFNAANNWGSSTGKIGPGVTVHLCGTISSYLTAQADGSPGNPITIFFEPNAKISLAYFTNTSGLISIHGRSWITIDGGSNGIIELTANGTTLAHQSDGYGIDVGGASNFIITNLTIQNLYVRTGTTDSNGWGYAFFGSPGVSGNNRITNNVMHDMSTCWIFNVNGSMEIDHNDCGRVSWGFASGGGSPVGFLFHDNKLHDGSVWYQVNDVFHNDAFHIWTTGGNWNNAQVFNNDFYGDWGTFTTGLVYMECDNTPSSCPLLIYNNIFRATSALTNGRVALKDAQNVRIFNNYFSGHGNAIHIENGGAGGSSGIVSENNIFSSVDTVYAIGPTPSSYGTRDYNDYYNTGQMPTGSHDITTNPNVNTNFVPQINSPVINAGINLSSLGIAALNSDKAGNPRPASGTWDIGAYEYISGAPPSDTTPPSPPANVSVN